MLRWFGAGFFVCSLLVTMLAWWWPTPDVPVQQRRQAVVLLHGIALSSDLLKPLQVFLEQQGYQVVNIDYDSTRYPLDQLVEYQVAPRIRQHLGAYDGIVHFVSFSMGGLLVRDYLKQYRPRYLGRVVMIGPPNQGSELADSLRHMKLYQEIYGPAGQQLTTEAVPVESVDYELGVIAGDVALDPISPFLIPGKDDGRVSVERTRLPGMKEQVVVHAPHTLLQLLPDVWVKIARFLETGSFLVSGKQGVETEGSQ